MDIIEAIKKRHSVRQYKEKAIEPDILKKLNAELDAVNEEADLNFQLITDEPKAFSGMLARYGKFKGVTNYIALVAKKRKNLDEVCGYYGERVVLKAQQMGLHTCWVALTYKKIPNTFTVKNDEKFTVVISVGYGKNRGVIRRSKSAGEVSNITADSPEWFKNGIESALLAPTARNQQKFYLTLNADGSVTAKAGIGFYTRMDLGIVKYHFEAAAGKENFIWK